MNREKAITALSVITRKKQLHVQNHQSKRIKTVKCINIWYLGLKLGSTSSPHIRTGWMSTTHARGCYQGAIHVPHMHNCAPMTWWATCFLLWYTFVFFFGREGWELTHGYHFITKYNLRSIRVANPCFFVCFFLSGRQPEKLEKAYIQNYADPSSI